MSAVWMYIVTAVGRAWRARSACTRPETCLSSRGIGLWSITWKAMGKGKGLTSPSCVKLYITGTKTNVSIPLIVDWSQPTAGERRLKEASRVTGSPLAPKTKVRLGTCDVNTLCETNQARSPVRWNGPGWISGESVSVEAPSTSRVNDACLCVCAPALPFKDFTLKNIKISFSCNVQRGNREHSGGGGGGVTGGHCGLCPLHLLQM